MTNVATPNLLDLIEMNATNDPQLWVAEFSAANDEGAPSDSVPPGPLVQSLAGRVAALSICSDEGPIISADGDLSARAFDYSVCSDEGSDG
ncbi:hypothetical protein [Aestuariivirga sp.]|jgi:hypothetical protein|uniref:hypothetical protein n=1 Tax=Aestuariivirga sp. TaxID=2650926 RepID=UPI0037850604